MIAEKGVVVVEVAIIVEGNELYINCERLIKVSAVKIFFVWSEPEMNNDFFYSEAFLEVFFNTLLSSNFYLNYLISLIEKR